MQIGSEDEPANMDGSLYAQINYYMEAANTATNNASDLMEQIGGMDDPANMEGSLYAQINYYMEAASDLMEQIGGMDDPANMEGSLYAQINHYMEAASDLMEQIGSEDAPANMEGSLYAQINYHMEAANTAAGEASDLMEQIGDMDDPANMEGSLYAQINYHMEQAEDLRGEIGTPDDEANDSEDATLHAQLNAAKDRIAELEAGTAPDLLDPIVEDAMAAYTAANTASMAADTAAGDAETAADEPGDDADRHGQFGYGCCDRQDARGHGDGRGREGRDGFRNGAVRSEHDRCNGPEDSRRGRSRCGNAETAKGHGGRPRKGEAEADAAMELKIDGSMKSVGGTSVDDTAGANSITVNGETTITGRLANSLQPNHTVAADLGQAFANTADSPPNPNTPRRQAYDARTFDIGKTLDSSDDMARLMLVTQYAGTMAVNVYSLGDSTVTAETQEGTESGRISIDVTATTDDRDQQRRSQIRGHALSRRRRH